MISIKMDSVTTTIIIQTAIMMVETVANVKMNFKRDYVQDVFVMILIMSLIVNFQLVIEDKVDVNDAANNYLSVCLIKSEKKLKQTCSSLETIFS